MSMNCNIPFQCDYNAKDMKTQTQKLNYDPV